MLNVLILDDDELFNRTLTRVLERDESLNCTVTAVNDDMGACEAVRNAEPPFDVFLIDQRLGPGRDGIEILEDLQHLSPNSQAIVFTEAGNVESGLRAYRAGAYRYLHKPFEIEELVLVLKSLLALQQVQRERDWLRVHAEIAEASQRPLTVEEMGQVVVESAQRLGFERARLWLLLPDNSALVGANEAGNRGLERFRECRIGLTEVPYIDVALHSHHPCIFNGLDLGESYLYRRYKDDGYEEAEGDWVGLSLWSEEQRMGVLMLDNYSQPRKIGAEEQKQLTLFGKLVAAALERAQLFEQERRKSKEVELLATIGRHISERAAVISLDNLVAEIHRLIGQFIDANTFFLALYNDRTRIIERRLEYINSERNKLAAIQFGQGLTDYILRQNEPLLLTTEAAIRTFRQQHHIRKKDPPARCWLGVPLSVEGRPIGVIAVQSFAYEYVFTEDHKLLLSAVADQVAGAIQTARLREAEHTASGRLAVLQRVSEELLKRALLDEGQMWHAVLTATTAEYGLRFNRAMLFLLDPGGATLIGECGIGHLNSREARLSWRRDIKQKVTLDRYLAQLSQQTLPSTPVNNAIRTLRIDLHSEGKIFADAIHDREWKLVPSDQVDRRMPKAFVKLFGLVEYAIQPIVVNERSIGLLVVDNAYNNVPINLMPNSDLERLLSQAALAYDSLVQRRAALSLLEVGKQALMRIAERPLHETLSQVCEVARAITGASCVTILPLSAQVGSDQGLFDASRIGFAGLQHQNQALYLNPDAHYNLRENQHVVIDDTAITELDIGTASFLKREGICASLMAPIFDHEDNTFVGTLQLYYRTPRSFNSEDIKRAFSLADLAGAVIHSAEAHRQELRIQASVLKKALELNSDNPNAEQQLAQSLIKAAHELLGQPDTRVGVLMRAWEEPEGPRMPQELRRQYFLVGSELRLNIEEQLDRGITGLVFRDGAPRRVGDVSQPFWAEQFIPQYQPAHSTRSELDVPIVLDGQILGVINAESPRIDAYSEEHQATIERLAATAALALGNLRRQQNLRKVMLAAQTVVTPSDLDATLAALIDAARQVAPGVGALTLWYRDPVTAQVMLYPHYFGVMHPGQIYHGPAKPDSTVMQVMSQTTPLFAIDHHDYRCLGGAFVDNEQIVSAAALPLIADDEAVGVIFFNYRERHEFTSEERTLFQTIAAVASSSIRDAMRLEELKNERQHLERERRRLDVATRITEAVGTTLDRDETLVKVMGTLREIFAEDQICLMIYDPEEQVLRFAPTSRPYYGFDRIDSLQSLGVFESQGIVCRVARRTLESRQAEIENIGDVLADPDYLRVNPGTRSELCVSLVGVDGSLLGLLVLESNHVKAFSDDDEDLVWAAAQSIGIAIERANQSSQLRFKASVADATVWMHEFRHDINRAISIIRGQAYLIKQAAPGKYQPYLDKIDTQAEQLKAYIKASGAKETTALCLDDWLNSWFAAFSTPTQIRRGFFPGCPGIYVEVVPLLIERVLNHLLRNAIESMNNTGELILSSERLSRHARVKVYNTGDLDPAIFSRLWIEPVSTKHNQREGHEGGLGLLFVRSAVELMGGRVNLLPSPGKGVTFTFTLPIAIPETAGKDDAR